MDFLPVRHLTIKYASMTNNQILKANFLDILFENRNKDYGAYSLRKGYNIRMLKALIAGVAVLLLFVFISTRANRKVRMKPVLKVNDGIVIRTIEMPKEKIKEPVKPKEAVKQKTIQKIASVNYSTPPKITKDKEVKNGMVAIKDLENKEISTLTIKGKPAEQIVIINKPDKETIIITPSNTGPSQPAFVAEERDPQFPGGYDALKQFLARYLHTPDDLESGERKVVKIKFKVDKNGSVNTFEIITSAGSDLDNEVVRVFKKMPRWEPAIQNGINVSVNYMLPVTFIGAGD
jgi:periplasmic protein TonB